MRQRTQNPGGKPSEKFTQNIQQKLEHERGRLVQMNSAKINANRLPRERKKEEHKNNERDLVKRGGVFHHRKQSGIRGGALGKYLQKTKVFSECGSR